MEIMQIKMLEKTAKKKMPLPSSVSTNNTQ
jgi:hypothetical protein